VLRAIAGAVVTDVKMSTWFVLCTSFGSLFIVTGKRFAELREMGESSPPGQRSTSTRWASCRPCCRSASARRW
jgi:decaprenyl-phosphate phosphoribosyltransferase